MKRSVKVTALVMAMTTLMATVAFASSAEAPVFKEGLLSRLCGLRGQYLMPEGVGLTREQITEAINSGKNLEEIAQELNLDLEALRGNKVRFDCFGQVNGGGLHQLFLEKTGLTREELLELFRSGMSFEEIAKEYSIDLEALKQEILETRLALIDERVNEGKLTPEQAEALKDKIQAGLENCDGQQRGMMGGFKMNRGFGKTKTIKGTELQ